jgi:hypothetical protein
VLFHHHIALHERLLPLIVNGHISGTGTGEQLLYGLLPSKHTSRVRLDDTSSMASAPARLSPPPPSPPPPPPPVTAPGIITLNNQVKGTCETFDYV